MIQGLNISFKKFCLIIALILCALLIFKKDKVVKYFQEEKYYNALVKIHALKKCYNPSYHFEDIFIQEGLNYKTLNEQTINTSLTKLDHLNSANSETKIPKITHKIYFTSSQNTNLASFYFEELKANYTELNKIDVWQHNFWTNKQTIIPEDIEKIQGVKIRYFDELKNDSLYPVLENLILNGQQKKPYLAQAADLFRLMVMQRWGGVYSDVDYETYDPAELLKLMSNFDFIGGREHYGVNSYYGNSFLAAKPNHPILNEAISLSKRNYSQNQDLPDYLKYPCSNYDTLYFNGPPLITIAYFNKNNLDGNNDIILPPWMLYNVNFILYKNKSCDLIKSNNVSLKEYNLAIDDLQRDFFKNPIIIPGQQYDLDVSSKIHENIFYNLKDRNQYKIIGADMFCGSWTEKGKAFKKIFYWNIPIWQ